VASGIRPVGDPWAIRCVHLTDAAGHRWVECSYVDADGEEHALRGEAPLGAESDVEAQLRAYLGRRQALDPRSADV
jgi:hypothetical protein